MLGRGHVMSAMTTTILRSLLGAGISALVTYFLTREAVRSVYLRKVGDAEKETAAARATVSNWPDRSRKET